MGALLILDGIADRSTRFENAVKLMTEENIFCFFVHFFS